MKKIYSLMFLGLGFVLTQAQLAIGKEQVDGAGILDFATGTTKGILLPIVTQLPNQPANGTFIMNHDVSDANYLKVMVFENNQWKTLSEQGTISTITENGQNLTTPYEFNESQNEGEGVVIGENLLQEEIPSGVLVLESSNKALILPKVEDPHLHVKSPRAGTILYDTTTKSLVVFDGNVWNFWQ